MVQVCSMLGIHSSDLRKLCGLKPSTYLEAFFFWDNHLFSWEAAILYHREDPFQPPDLSFAWPYEGKAMPTRVITLEIIGYQRRERYSMVTTSLCLVDQVWCHLIHLSHLTAYQFILYHPDEGLWHWVEIWKQLVYWENNCKWKLKMWGQYSKLLSLPCHLPTFPPIRSHTDCVAVLHQVNWLIEWPSPISYELWSQDRCWTRFYVSTHVGRPPLIMSLTS